MWTHFWDMHSGGGCKEKPYEHIYIEADGDAAEIIFQNKFGHNPNRVSCTCCGADYVIDTTETLEQASAYHRGCAFENNAYVERPAAGKLEWHTFRTVDEYRKLPDVLIIPASEIKDEWRKGELIEQGYVWRD